MKLHTLMPVRNDDWCLGFSARVALRWCDTLHLLVHASGVATHKIVEDLRQEYHDRVTVHIEPNEAWDEMDHRQMLLQKARSFGATHIALVDADEALTSNLLSVIPALVETTPVRTCLSLPKIDCWNGVQQYRSAKPFYVPLSFAFQDQPDYKWETRRYDYQHHCRPPQPLTQGHCPQVDGGIFHLQFARPRALRAKQAHYKAIEFLRWPEFGMDRINKRYSWWQVPVLDLRETSRDWWIKYQDILPLLDLSDDKPSWHETALCDLIKQHGRERFAGLDLFGIV